MSTAAGRDPIVLRGVAAYIDTLLDVSRYREPHANTLTIGWESAQANTPVTRITAALNTSFAAIEHAMQSGAQLLIVHHASWPQSDLHLTGEKEERLREAGIGLYVAHSALDGASEIGTADVLAAALGLRIEGRFAPHEGGSVGVYGQVDDSWEAFVQRARTAIGPSVQAHRNAEHFGRIALTTGSGAGAFTTVVEEARQLGCDTYVTGEATMFTRLFAHEVHLNLLTATQYSTEAPAVRALVQRVGEHFGLDWDFFEDLDPEVGDRA